MDSFSLLEKMLGIVDEMKNNICLMMDVEIKRRLILEKESRGKQGGSDDILK